MKCRGNECTSYSEDYFYPICQETNIRTTIDVECKLFKNIAEIRDELIRKCRLFEEVFEIDVSDNLDTEVEKIEGAD